MLFVLGIEGTGHHVVRNILEASANDSGWAVLDSSVQPHYHTETALKVRQLVITLFHKPNNISPQGWRTPSHLSLQLNTRHL